MPKKREPIELLEKKIGLNPGFLKRLDSVDDWSFVIKLHALLEAACTNLLMHHFKEPDLFDLFSRIELSGRAIGKVVMLEKLRLLAKAHRQYLFALSELRNNLAHDVRNVNFDFRTYYDSLDKAGARNFALFFDPSAAIGRELREVALSSRGSKEDWVESCKVENTIARATKNPRQHVWLGAHTVLNYMIEIEEFSTYVQWAKAQATFGHNIES